jgi:beta-galactosidase
VIQQLDPSRLIVGAIFKAHMGYNQIPDHPAFNRYPGWYQHFGLLESQIKEGTKEVGKRIALSEYGAGANTAQHVEGPLVQPKPAGSFHPEEWQTNVHKADWAGMKDNPLLWGTFVWAMFDFQVAARHEGGQSDINDKGLVTQDRKTKKDAYFFYQANWTDQPMVHIASSRMTPRRVAVTGVEVFSNCDKVELIVNNQSLGFVPADNLRAFHWPNVTLQPGRNDIKAVASSSRGEFTDSCEWVLDATLAPVAQ